MPKIPSKFTIKREKFGITREGPKKVGPWNKEPTKKQWDAIRSVRKMNESQMAVSKNKTLSQKYNTAIKRMKDKAKNILKKEDPYVKFAKDKAKEYDRKGTHVPGRLMEDIIKRYKLYGGTKPLPETFAKSLRSIGYDSILITHGLHSIGKGTYKKQIINGKEYIKYIPTVSPEEVVKILDSLLFTREEIKYALKRSSYKDVPGIEEIIGKLWSIKIK